MPPGMLVVHRGRVGRPNARIMCAIDGAIACAAPKSWWSVTYAAPIPSRKPDVSSSTSSPSRYQLCATALARMSVAMCTCTPSSSLSIFATGTRIRNSGVFVRMIMLVTGWRHARDDQARAAKRFYLSACSLGAAADSIGNADDGSLKAIIAGFVGYGFSGQNHAVRRGHGDADGIFRQPNSGRARPIRVDPKQHPWPARFAADRTRFDQRPLSEQLIDYIRVYVRSS